MRKTFLSFFFNQQTGKVFFQMIVSDAVRHVILCPPASQSPQGP